MAVAPNADVVIRTKDNSATSDADTLTIFAESQAQLLRAIAVAELYGTVARDSRQRNPYKATLTVNPRYTTASVSAEIMAAALVADLAITISASPTSAAEGANIVFTITVTNNGPDKLTDVAASAPIPATMTTTANSPASGTTFNAGTGAWTIGALDSGQSKVLTVTADGDGGSAGAKSYPVTVSGTRTDGTAGNNSASVNFTVTAP